MSDQPCHRLVLAWLVTLLLTLPILAWALIGVGALLGAMGDQDGRVLFFRLAAACAALWVVDLVGCVVALAVETLGQQRWQPPESASEPTEPQPED